MILEFKIKLLQMIKDNEFETYLRITPNKFGIYLYDKKNSKNFYKDEINLKNETNIIDLNTLNEFLEHKIFKIEKIIGDFIRNISIVIESPKIKNVNIGIKMKNYGKKINKEHLEKLLIDAKDLFKDNYQNEKIMHLLINRYFINGKYFTEFENNLPTDDFCIEAKFLYISKDYEVKINKALEKYQIKIIKYIDESYLKKYFEKEKVEFPEMVYQIQNGINQNEVKLIPKSNKIPGFFEKFFQLFS